MAAEEKAPESASIQNTSYKIVLVILAVVLLWLAAVLGTYFWQQARVDDLHKQVNTLQSQLDEQTDNVKELQQQLSTINVPETTYQSLRGVTIHLFLPTKNEVVTSPLPIFGEVPGNWSFEASFPIQLKNSQGKIIAQTTAQLLGDWMTDQLVPFSAKMTFTTQPSGTGVLILHKDNPSGIAQNSDSLSVPIRF